MWLVAPVLCSAERTPECQTTRDAAQRQHPEAFATLDELGAFIEWGIHLFFHHAAALRWNESALETMASLRHHFAASA